MAPSRRNINGRSPLVNKQHQITAFFSKSPLSQNPQFSSKPTNPNPNPSPTSSPPTTPSPLNAKLKPSSFTHKSKPKPLLVIGSQPSKIESFGEEVANRRIRVFWPLDKEWYEGCVKSFDRVSGKHVVEYDDAEEELLDLSSEKIEWIEGSVKKFRRLRKVSVVVDDDDEEDNEGNVGPSDDDSSDEDWGKNAAVEAATVEEAECLEDLELEDEDKEVEKRMKRKKGEIKKGKSKDKDGEEVETGGSCKKRKCGFVISDVDSKLGKPVVKCEDVGQVNAVANIMKSDAIERFGDRDEQKLPFLGKDRRDAKRRLPSDANFDSKTLYLPPQFLKSLTGGQRQWWEFKSKHMDKVLFFKMGKFYELFEMDAHVGVKELDLQYMRGDQPHCGFPEKNFSINVEKLAKKGYRVLVVEQTETPDQLEKRRREEGSKDKVVKREICAIVTKGTLNDGEMMFAKPDASYIISLNEGSLASSNNNERRVYGVCVIDVSTSQIVIGQMKDDLECSALCCLLSELRPVEIIKPAKMLTLVTEKALTRHTRNPLVNDLVPGVEFWDADTTACELKRFYGSINNVSVSSEKAPMEVTGCTFQDELCCLPDVLKDLLTAGNDGDLALSALGGAIYYLRKAFLDETLLRYATIEALPCIGSHNLIQKPYMVLDAAALENLEIFENSRNGDSNGTLYTQFNHCVTAFGKRLLKAWIARPLYHAESIRQRQDAIAGLKGNNLSIALEFRKELLKLPDMERLLTRLFASSEANGRNAHKIILYEDASKKQLQEFISVLQGCEVMISASSSLGTILDNTNSQYLHHLLSPGKGLPDVSSILEQFRDAFDWVEANSSGRIIPHEGVDTEYDSASKKMEEIKFNLKNHLTEQKKLLGDKSINYVAVGKDTYLLEVPESSSGRIPQDYELKSSKKGFRRYWSPYIKKMLGELAKAESEKESKLKHILQILMERFCNHHSKWRQLVSTVAELDVLISLVIASDYYEGPTCRPVILTGCDLNTVPQLTAKSLGHPILRSDSLGKGTFVPNDINIGGSHNASFILLTGPNMGGKSTLLRQICLAVILAQVGADVPAEHFELSLVDRIFVRMGAKDHIMAGHSTFLTELSETASMLTSATRDSLVALDELGRGTSTSDGQAIAESVLEHFVRKVQCRGMFSTHYHRLAIDYKQDPKVSLCHMACQVGEGDGGLEEVTFLYRMTSGACPKSYGVNVARLAGIPDSILSKAAIKSREFEASYGRKRDVSCNNVHRWNEEAMSFLKNLNSIAADTGSSKMSSNTRVYLLKQLQQKARILLEQC